MSRESSQFGPQASRARDTGCDLRLEDARVARWHAEIYPVGALWWVRDLGSDDGTYLNGEIIEAAPLEASSELRLGADGPTLRLDALNGRLQGWPTVERCADA